MRRLAGRVAFAALLAGFAAALQAAAPQLGSVDGYFHIRYSALLAAAGWRDFPPEFPWLPLTILAPDRYYDHHLLFHVLIAPLARGNLIAAAKLLSAAGAAAVFIAIYAVLLGRRVPRAEWWTIAILAAAPGFLYRIEMPRVQALSLLTLLGAFVLSTRDRPPSPGRAAAVAMLALAWFYTYLYDAFPLLLGICGCTLAAQWLTGAELRWRAAAAALAGVAGGLLVNPYFPHNLRFIVHHYLAKAGPDSAVAAGAEWQPLLVARWLGWAGLLALLSGVGFLFHRHRRRLDATQATAVLIAAFLLVPLWRSARFVEYFVPFCGIALAVTLGGAVDAALPRTGRLRRHIAVALLLWLAATSTYAVLQLRSRPPAQRYAAASAWIRSHTPRGTLVFLSDWDDFPLAYYHNTESRYVIGLDPTYLAERDPRLYEIWRRAAEGTLPDIARTIRRELGATVALTDHAHADFIAAMDRDPAAHRAFADGDGIVYTID